MGRRARSDGPKKAENCEPGGTLPPGRWSNRKLHCYANPMLMRTILSLLAVLAAGAVMAQAYTWVDEDGIVHYSDRPEAGATQIQLPQPNRQNRSFSRPAAAPVNAAQSAAEEPAREFSYETIEISSPAPEETLWNLGGVLNVSLNVQPGLRPGHRVRVYFDGTAQMVNGSSFQIQEVYRGVHNLQAEVLDENGKLMGRSQPNRFYVQQNTIVRN
jgi:hypothetical protein